MQPLQNTTPGGQYLEVFSKEELLLISNSLKKLKDAPNSSGKFHAYTNGFCTTDLIYPFFKKTVMEKLENLFGRTLKLTHGMYLKEQVPWLIHTDYVKTDKRPDWAFLIPLNTENLDTHTVVFNQQCLDTFSQFMLTNKKLDQNASGLISSLMSHETTDRLEYVSLQGAYRWITGSVIHWNRRLLHASDNFIPNGFIEKQALVLFTNQD
jgi:hypothetical protein